MRNGRFSVSTSRVFVSHSHQDNDYCREFVAALRGHGYDVWYDEHNLGWGALRPTIEKEMPLCQHFIAIFSPDSVASDWVNTEIDAALELRKEGIVQTITFVVARECTVPLLLRRWKRIEGSGAAAVNAQEAAGRATAVLSSVPVSDNAAPIISPQRDIRPPLRDAQVFNDDVPYGRPSAACFRCGTVNNPQNRFCMFCGYDQAGGRAQVDRFLAPNGRPLRCRLTFQNGLLAGRSFLLHQDVTTIGRTTGNDVLILDGAVSRNHARLIFHNGYWSIEDAASTTGTMVNGKKVKRPRKLSPGDQIQIGDVVIVFETIS